MRAQRSGSRAWITLAVCVLAAGCDNGPDPASARPRGATGPQVVWDLGARPFPEIPVPNDVATWPDPTSATGLRVNASMIASTGYERALREQFDEMDGWGTFMPITISFDADLNLDDLVRRHGDEFDFRNDAVYLVDLETGVPVPLDVGNGNYPLTLHDPAGWLQNDPRAGQSNLLLATFDEDSDGDGVLSPEEDTNHDGILQHASLAHPGDIPENALTTFFESEDVDGNAHRTLILRPMVPLLERHRYAVVITDRLVGTDGQPVRSAFATIAHPSQLDTLAPLRAHLDDPTLAARFFGHLSWGPAADGGIAGGQVAFAWVFTTQTTTSDLFEVHDGLYGRGRFASLAGTTPDFTPQPAQGGADCHLAPGQSEFLVNRDQIKSIITTFASAFGFPQAQADALVASYDWVDYALIATIHTPYLAGDPRSPDPDSRWHLDALAQNAGVAGQDTVQLWIFVPRTRDGARPPFPVAFNAHGYGAGALQSIAFAGYFARMGLATVAANAPDHGFPLDAGYARALQLLLSGMCLRPFGIAATAGRSRDINGDNSDDSGADFLTAHAFHTRDMVRQAAVDYMQTVRALTDASFATPGGVDYNGDGQMDAPGDFNGDGVVDIGRASDGTATPFYMWGESLGGITSMVLGPLDPAITAVAPVSGGAGLTDVLLRSNVDGVGGAAILPSMGPAIIAVPAAERPDVSGRSQTACQPDEFSLRWLTPDANLVGELEFACSPTSGESAQFAPGDDIIAANLENGLLRCTRVPASGRLFIPLPSDKGDRVVLTVYRGAAVTSFRTCELATTAQMRAAIHTFQVGEGMCDDGCGHVPPRAPANSPARRNGYLPGTDLVAPSSGLGLRRQTSELRRFLQLAQAAIDPGDPVNYAPLFFLRPRTANAHPVLSMTTAGDPSVPVAAGNTFARAAGQLPFIRTPTGSALDEYVAPESITSRYDATPDTVLVRESVIEGISRLNRHPIPGHADYLFDPDNLDEGMQPFGEAELVPPLRLVRAARPLRTDDTTLVDPAVTTASLDALWHPPANTPLSGFINAYVIPTGVHTFLPSDPSQPWDVGNYLTNLITRFFQSRGNDIVFYTDPSGHQCLENSSCAFIPAAP